MDILRLVVIIVCIIFVVLVFRQVATGKLMLKYSLLWLALALVAFLVAIFPEPIFAFAHFLGFELPLNFIVFIALFFLLTICISLSIVISKQDQRIKTLIQNQAILEKELKELIEKSRS